MCLTTGTSDRVLYLSNILQITWQLKEVNTRTHEHQPIHTPTHPQTPTPFKNYFLFFYRARLS